MNRKIGSMSCTGTWDNNIVTGSNPPQLVLNVVSFT